MITTELNVTRKRGDTIPIEFTLLQAGSPKNITGATFLLTVDPEPDPTGIANNKFSIPGFIIGAAAGTFEFRPSAVQMDLTPETYYFDVQMTLGGYISTIIKGKFIVQQDITK